jgi:DNA-directed RNA polymerase II subunit RPB2
MERNPEDKQFHEKITQEDAWVVIKSYFKQHGLVSQQISSFDRFLQFNVQEVVKEHASNRIKLEPQYIPGKDYS